MTNRLLKRRYISNGFSVMIYYFPPDELIDGFFVISLGYEGDGVYSDIEYISLVVIDGMNIEYVWKDMIKFADGFNIWNRQWKKL